MADSVTGQDEANPVFYLDTRAGKMGLSCPLGIARFSPQREILLCNLWPYNKSFVDQACSVKMAGYSRALFYGLPLHLGPRKELGQYPAILTEQACSITHISTRTTFLF